MVPVTTTCSDTKIANVSSGWKMTTKDKSAIPIRIAASSGLPRDHDGLLVRGIWRFALDVEEGAKAASLDRAGWSPGNLAMMAEDGT